MSITSVICRQAMRQLFDGKISVQELREIADREKQKFNRQLKLKEML